MPPLTPPDDAGLGTRATTACGHADTCYLPPRHVGPHTDGSLNALLADAVCDIEHGRHDGLYTCDKARFRADALVERMVRGTR